MTAEMLHTVRGHGLESRPGTRWAYAAAVAREAAPVIAAIDAAEGKVGSAEETAEALGRVLWETHDGDPPWGASAVVTRVEGLWFQASRHEECWRRAAERFWAGDPAAIRAVVGGELSGRLPDGPVELRTALERSVVEWTELYRRDVIEPFLARGAGEGDSARRLRGWACRRAWRHFLGTRLLTDETLALFDLTDKETWVVKDRAVELVIHAQLLDASTAERLVTTARAIALADQPVRSSRDPEAPPRGRSARGARLSPPAPLEDPETSEESATTIDGVRAELQRQRLAILDAVQRVRVEMLPLAKGRYVRLLDSIVQDDPGEMLRRLREIVEDPAKIEPVLSRARRERRWRLARFGIVRGVSIRPGERLGARHVVPPEAVGENAPLVEPARACGVLETELRLLIVSARPARDDAFWDEVERLLRELRTARAALRVAMHGAHRMCIWERGLVGKPFDDVPHRLWRREPQGRAPAAHSEPPEDHAAEEGRVIVRPARASQAWEIELEPTVDALARDGAGELAGLAEVLREPSPGVWLYFPMGGVDVAD